MSALIHELPLGLSLKRHDITPGISDGPNMLMWQKYIAGLWVSGSGDPRYQHRNGSMFVRVWEPSEAEVRAMSGFSRLTEVPAQVLYNGRVQKVGDLPFLVGAMFVASESSQTAEQERERVRERKGERVL